VQLPNASTLLDRLGWNSAARDRFPLDEDGIAAFLGSGRLAWLPKPDPLRLGLVTGLLLELALLLFSWLDGHRGGHAEPLSAVLMVHVRCMVMIPALIAGNKVARFYLLWILSQFHDSGLLAGEAGAERLRAILREYHALRDMRLALVVIVVLAFLPATTGWLGVKEIDAMAWARLPDGSVGAVGLWYGFVVKPLSAILMMFWIWRLWILLLLLCARLSRLPLAFAPTHPDGAGGLGFVADLPLFQAPLLFALSSVACSGLAEGILAGEFSLHKQPYVLVVLVVVLVAAALAPLLPFMRTVRNMAYDAWDDYHGLLVRHGQMVHERWIEGREVTDEKGLLEAPEIGPVADVGALFERVDAIDPVMISRGTVIVLVAVTAAPVVPLVLIEYPVIEIVKMLSGFVL
jgi:hypothetical protein